MPAPSNIKKNGVLLTSSDICPRCPHLLSRHQAEVDQGQCRDCACVTQTVANHITRDASKVGA
jgi:hypothetical protein